MNFNRLTAFLEKTLCLSVVFFFIGLVIPADAFAADKEQIRPNVISLVDCLISELQPYIASYPPNVRNKADRQKIHTQLNEAIVFTDILLSKDPDNPHLLWRMGELYRMAHNLDLKDAWINSEKALKKAIQIAPGIIEAHLTLGDLYVNTDLNHAKEAEKCFLTAQRISGEKPLIRAHRGLLFAYYYQGDMKKTLDEADLINALFPNDEIANIIAGYARKNLNKNESPSIHHVR